MRSPELVRAVRWWLLMLGISILLYLIVGACILAAL
jgi:hypothetical protein